jgi:hypothetical protein
MLMESAMTRVFNLSELLVGGFGGSDPITGFRRHLRRLVL